MPELPDLEVIRAYLAPRLAGVEISAVEVRRPIIVRNLLGGDVGETLIGRTFNGVNRRGKFLLLGLSTAVEPESEDNTSGSSTAATPASTTLVINPMLAGRLRYGTPLGRHRTRDALILRLSDGNELRYNDAVDMGKIYLAADLAQIPGYSDQGPDADDPALTLELFRERLRRRPGEIKGILTTQAFVAGIGNAYADEILWAARLYPFRRRPSLTSDDVATLHRAMAIVLANAVATLQARVGDAIDVEIRDFLAIHGKPGKACPRCGAVISQVQRQGIATHFCRTCQPGLMLDR